MRDYIVRAAFHQKILQKAHNESNTFVVDELGLKNGEIRADIAVLNGKFVGYEIKTDKDNLKRLPSQVEAYSEIFDQAYVITGKKHFDKVIKCLPEWWGIYIIEPGEEDCSFSCFRPAEYNMFRNRRSIVQLLWKDEARELLETQFNLKVKQSWARTKLYDILAVTCDIQILADAVLKILKNRQDWRKDLRSQL